jgi:hypothetical protein
LFSGVEALQLNAVQTIANMSVDASLSEKIHSYGGVLGLITLLGTQNAGMFESNVW